VAVWFLQRMEGNVQTEVGPLRPTELLSMVRKGEIKPETKLRKDDSAWFPASDVGGLFEAASRQEVQYFCPACNRRISQPPITCPGCLRDIGRRDARVVQPEKLANVPIPVESQESKEEHRSAQSWFQKKVANKQKK
jgi:hypothetical protein